VIIRPAAPVTATVVLGAAVLLLFANLTLRHVGESYFLADQVDQLQKYEAALRLEPEGLWGPVMSGTSARALGPFGALMLGLPLSLGFGIDAIHAFTSVLLALATALAFWQLARLHFLLAWSWLLVFTSMRMVWWNAAMFWVNTLLLPLGLVALALFAATVRKPSIPKVAGIAVALLLALHVHLAALVGLPIVLIAAMRLRTARPTSSGSLAAGLTGAAIALAVLPYLVAEVQTGFRNTRAMVNHVEAATASDGGDGARAAAETLSLAADPMSIFPEQQVVGLTAGAVLACVAFGLLLWRRWAFTASTGEAVTAMLWLVAAAVVVVAGQAVFFLLMGRSFNGLHYAILLAPWYAIPPAALLAALSPDRRSRRTERASVVFGVVAVLLMLARAPGLADRFAERTPWNFSAIVAALDALCAGQTVHTVEGPGLANDLTPASDSVLRYLMKRGFTRCRYGADSDIVIAANRDGAFDERIDLDGRQFTRERVVQPGLALYREVP
jgi:hypothetical protein